MIKFFFISLVLLTFAHPLDMGLMLIQGEGNEFTVRLELNPFAAANLLRIEPGKLTAAVTATKGNELFTKTLKRSKISVGGRPCKWKGPATANYVGPQNLSLSAGISCSSGLGPVVVELPFVKDLAETFQLLVRIERAGGEQLKIAERERTRLTFSAREPETTLLRFITMGIDHIGVSPKEWKNARGFHLPFGIDHILFVIALLLGGGGALNLLKTITGFTLGHTISLALTLIGVIHVSSRWVEAAIALTIALVAMDNLFRFRPEHRWRLTIGIGLVHGMGFASALADLHLKSFGLFRAILGFNLGVEVGQAVIVLLAFPFLKILQSTLVGRRMILPLLSTLVCALGFYWFFERAFV